MKNLLIISLLFLVPFSLPSILQSQSDSETIVSCSFGKIVFGKVFPYTNPEFEIPKVWVIRKVSDDSVDQNGDFNPVDFNETGNRFYMNYHADDEVTATFTKARIHESLVDQGHWRYFNIYLDRISGTISVDVRNVAAGDQKDADDYPIIGQFEGKCRELKKKF